MASNEQAIELAFEAAKLGARLIARRQLRKEEEAALLAEVRAKESARVIPTVEELERDAPKNRAAKGTPDETA